MPVWYSNGDSRSAANNGGSEKLAAMGSDIRLEKETGRMFSEAACRVGEWSCLLKLLLFSG